MLNNLFNRKNKFIYKKITFNDSEIIEK